MGERERLSEAMGLQMPGFPQGACPRSRESQEELKHRLSKQPPEGHDPSVQESVSARTREPLRPLPAASTGTR